MEVKENSALNILRIIAIVVVAAAAAASLGLVLHAGRNNSSVVLPVLFAVWVLSPFMALMVAITVFKHWLLITRIALYSLALLLSLGSLVGYSGVFTPPGAKPAGIFLVVPLISWILLAIVVPPAAALARKNATRQKNQPRETA